MNREIKFRAWQGEQMVEWDKLKNLRYSIENENITVMQYTGIKDVNGEEIYEGDLLELANGETISVSFKYGKFLGIRKNGTTSLTSFYWIYAKKIGDIYENPELLHP